MSSLDLVLEKLEQAKRYRNYVHAKCPFHSPDNKPSFFVYEDSYRCLSCNAHGSTKSLLNRLSSLPERIKVYDGQQSRNPFTRWIANWGLHKTIEIARLHGTSQYLLKRGINATCQNTLGLGKLEGFLTFPIYSKWQEIVGCVARVGENNTSSAKYYLPNGQDPKLLYVPSWERIRTSNKVFVTFGIIDAISLYILGLPACSTTTGQRVSPSAFDDIRKRIIFVPDKHEEQSALQIASKLGWRGDVIRLPYPLHTKDPNNLLITDRKLLYECLGG